MKIFTLIFLLLVTHLASGQSKLPVIRAISKKALIIEGDEDRYNWNLSPKTRPDVHTITKSPQPKWVKFYTDIDSIKVKLKPGEKFDFIVLLNEKDSCYTRIESPAVKNYAKQYPVLHDTLKFILTSFNNLKFKAVLNQADTLNLMFDSGTTGLLLTNECIKHKIHSLNLESDQHQLQVGNLTWKGLRIYPVELSGQETDGRFGWDLFDGKVVEIDYDKCLFIVHTQLPKMGKGYSRLKMDYRYNLFCINAALQIKNKKYKNLFLFDSGYQRTIMLDTVLTKEQQFPDDLKVIKKVIMKNGQGRAIPVITVNNERFNIGNESLFNIPVQLMATANPARFKTHILGNEVLKRFNTVLDFQNNMVYLKLNTLKDLPYVE